MPRTKQNYSRDLVDISRSSILELWRALRRFNDSMVLVGGWAPYFILESNGEDFYEHDHIGSIDIDIAVDPSRLSEEQYETMESMIFDLGFSLKKDRKGDPIPFIFEKELDNGRYTVEVDVLTSNYGNIGHRHNRISGLLARKCHGVDIAFSRFFEVGMEGELPSGGMTKESVKIADVVGSITMKGIALGDRYKEKDAYDIYYLVTYYKGGPSKIACEMKEVQKDRLVKEALGIIKKEFQGRDSAATIWVADFLDEVGEERKRRITDVHMNINAFLDAICE